MKGKNCAVNWFWHYYYSLWLIMIWTISICIPASIPWPKNDPTNSRSSGVWYFQSDGTKSIDSARFFASDKLISITTKCDEPKNLPEQFMSWFRESTSDPTILTLTLSSQSTTSDQIKKNSPNLDSLITEPDSCSLPPSTDPNSSLMERALCPWEWRLNRDETREPKLISEAKCLCHRSRGPMNVADCVPIQREFPVLRRVRCDEDGKYQYVKSYETITVGCHSVMPRVTRNAQPPEWMVRAKEI